MIRYTHVKYLITLVLLLNFGFACSAIGSDLNKELRWSQQVTESLMVGEAHWLTANNQKFLSLYTPSSSNKLIGGAILIHGIGVHPNWADVIYPLRIELPEHNWATLSIQMPILANNAPLTDYLPLFDAVPARIDAAIQFFNKLNINNIVLISHSFGGQMSSYYLSQKNNNPIQAWVAIGMNSSNYDVKLNTVKTLGQLKIPILDLFGSRDLESVIKSAPARAKAARNAGNNRYSQTEVIGADHFFANMDQQLISKVRFWLIKNANGIAIIKKGN